MPRLARAAEGRLQLRRLRVVYRELGYESSSPGEFHPQALTEPDVRLAPHPALITRPLVALPRRVPPHRWVDPATKRSDWAPSLHAHYRHFHATTGPSAPVPRIGTQALVGPPLGLLPWHRGDRFPGSMFEPESDSRHLYAGRRAGGQRISPALITEQRLNPGFDVVPTLSTRHPWFPCGRLSDSHLTRSRRAFSLTLTTGALDPSRSRWFGACLRRPTPRGLPSSRTHIAWRTSSSPGEFHPQALSDPDGRLAPHPALMIQPPAESRSARGPAGSGRVAPPDPASGLRWWSDASNVYISSAPI